jgi:hypothetical protein
MAIITAGTWPQAKSEKITAPVASDLRQLEIQFNLLLTNLSTVFAGLTGTGVITTTTPVVGTTNTITVPTSVIRINGVNTLLAADTNKAISATGNTIKAVKWGLFTIERVAAGTTTFVGAAGNSVGYATEALAIAAKPAQTAGTVRVAYVTLVAGASDWVGGTDGLVGGSGGTIATTTNFYAEPSVYDASVFTASQIANLSGTVLTSANY